jgi:hypothetical protein
MYILLVLTQVNKFPQSSKLYMLKAHAWGNYMTNQVCQKKNYD